MHNVLEALTRRIAKRTTRAGEPVLITDGDPLLMDAFAELGWDDPCPDTEPAERAEAKAREDDAADKAAAKLEAATVRDSERAVLPKSKGHTR